MTDLLTLVVRGFGYDITHVVTVDRDDLESAYWPSPQHRFTGIRTPVTGRCGNSVRSVQPCVVVMQPGTDVRCAHCRRVTGIERAERVPGVIGHEVGRESA